MLAASTISVICPASFRRTRPKSPGDWEDPVNYHLVLNTAALGYDGAAALIVARARELGWTSDAS